MFKVYWTYCVYKLCCERFDADCMGDALKFMEYLRSDPDMSFITMCSENPNSVGKPGVAEVDKDYNWTKRRSNERVKVTQLITVGKIYDDDYQ